MREVFEQRAFPGAPVVQLLAIGVEAEQPVADPGQRALGDLQHARVGGLAWVQLALAGWRRERDRTSGSAYALATALHIRYHHVGQGEATAAVMPVVTRLTPPENVAVAARIATALGVWKDGMSAGETAAATAEALEAFYRAIGMPTRVHELDIPPDDLPLLAHDTLKNFNANPGVRPEGYVDEMLRLLQAAW